eukprot:5404829-Amphidinium_carterae.1
MVTETWVLPLVAVALQSGTSGAGLRNLSTLRILRLSRIVKMARSIEALRTLVKGMISAIRAVTDPESDDPCVPLMSSRFFRGHGVTLTHLVVLETWQDGS